MTDILAGQDPEDEAPAAQPPAAPDFDIEARLTQMQQQFEKRISGFQKALNEKDAALKAAQREALDLRMSGMTEDEKAELQWQQIEEENIRLKQENALLALSTEYPDELPAFRAILAASSPKEQLDLIRQLRKQQQAAAPQSQPSPAEDEVEIPEVDYNNPLAAYMGATKTAPMVGGQPMTDELADRLLNSVSRMRT